MNINYQFARTKRPALLMSALPARNINRFPGLSLIGHILSFCTGDAGTSLMETALLLPILLLMVAGAIDLGRACYIAIEVSSAAQSGASYGAQNSTDTTGMISAAQLDAADVPTITATASYGCECSDGTSSSAACASIPSCTLNVVNYVEVDTAATYYPILPYPGISGSLVLTGRALVRAPH